MPIDALGEAIAEPAARLHAATYELLVMLCAFDAQKGWRTWPFGLTTPGQVTVSVWAQLRAPGFVLRSLAQLAHRHRHGRGAVSYAKVRAITRVATPDTEQKLLDVALAGTASHVERIVRAWRRTDRVIAAAQADARHLSRHLVTWIDDDGTVVLRGRLTPEIGAVVIRALNAASDQLFREAKAAPNPGGFVAEVDARQRKADALGRLAEVALAADLDAGAAGDRYQVVLHVDAPAPAEATQVPFDGALEVDDAAVHVSAETSRRLACDAGVVLMQHDADGHVLDVGRKTRTIPSAIRRALSARDRRCQFPACSARRCDAHHIEHWVDGGETSLDNLVLLCRRHHRLVHEGGFTPRREPDGTVSFFYADGTLLRLVPPAPRFHLANPLAPITDHLAARGITITPRTLPTWDGTPFNVVHAIDVLYVPRQPVVS